MWSILFSYFCFFLISHCVDCIVFGKIIIQKHVASHAESNIIYFVSKQEIWIIYLETFLTGFRYKVELSLIALDKYNYVTKCLNETRNAEYLDENNIISSVVTY